MQRKLTLFFIAVILSLISVITANAEEETLTITTYYPSPYGSYRELRAQRIAIGEAWYTGANVCWDDDPSCLGSIRVPTNNPDTDLVVEGNVGIGTTSPSRRLEIAIDDPATTLSSGQMLNLRNLNNTDNNRGEIVFINAAGIRTNYIGVQYTDQTNNKGDIYFNGLTGSNEFMRITSSGNIGIGTTGPTKKLYVKSDGSPASLLVLDASNVTNGYSRMDYITDGPTRWLVGAYNDVPRFDITSGPFGGPFSPMFVILDNGNVGIGTTSPQNKLDVEGGVAVGASYSGTNTAPTNGMIIQGNVGIGTTSPGAELEVNGKIYGWNVPKDVALTTTSHNGDFGGFSGMYNWIQSNGGNGYHVCDTFELMRWYQLHTTPIGEGWFNSGEMREWSGTEDTNDCLFWTSSWGGNHGITWKQSASSPYSQYQMVGGCSGSYKVFICK